MGPPRIPYVGYKPPSSGSSNSGPPKSAPRRAFALPTPGRGPPESAPSKSAPPKSAPPVNVKIPFRVLIVGRANAGKTTILQRVCDTTESPIIYREGKKVKLDPSVNRGEHEIDDELVFSNHPGYVFHDSKGIEAGGVEELEILKDFIRRKCEEKRLRKKLHAIWYCVPMDNHRPGLDIKFYDKICPDPDVPVIVVFTKYDQFQFNVEMDVEDDPDKYPEGNVSEVTQKLFEEYYLGPLGSDDRYVRLEEMDKKESRCDDLIEKTAATLSGYVAALMISAVQKDDLKLSVKTALTRVYAQADIEVEHVVRRCLLSFPWIWEELMKDTDSSGILQEKPNEDPLNNFTKLVVSLPAIAGLSGDHLILAVILILKHASFLMQSSLASELALTHAGLDYQEADINFKIQQYLKASSLWHLFQNYAKFIMATDIASSQPLSQPLDQTQGHEET